MKIIGNLNNWWIKILGIIRLGETKKQMKKEWKCNGKQ